MYEKSKDFDKSLNDISVVLAMDPYHLKARGRRGRVYDAQVNCLLHFLNFNKELLF
jgi:hypothetical protein